MILTSWRLFHWMPLILWSWIGEGHENWVDRFVTYLSISVFATESNRLRCAKSVFCWIRQAPDRTYTFGFWVVLRGNGLRAVVWRSGQCQWLLYVQQCVYTHTQTLCASHLYLFPLPLPFVAHYKNPNQLEQMISPVLHVEHGKLCNIFSIQLGGT